jgi:hypothetical protein
MKWFVSWLAVGLFASPVQVITFDQEALGKTPAGWSVPAPGSPVRWEIRRDQSARTQPYVLAQLSSDTPANRASIAILNAVTMRDGDVIVRLKPLTGQPDQGGGLVWRYRDPDNYYSVQANSSGSQVQVFKVENGRHTSLGAVKHELPANNWRLLKVSARGTRFQVYVDHRRIIQGNDGTFMDGGKVGLSTQADSVTYFDDFQVIPR